jgi:hypothetical protein
MDGHPSLWSSSFGARPDAQIGPRPGAANALRASLPRRERHLAGRRIRPAASHGPPPAEALPRPGPAGPDARLPPAGAPAPCPSRGHPPGGPRLTPPASDLGRRADPRPARRGPTPARLAQPPDDPPLVPRRRSGPRPGRAAGRVVGRPGRAAPSDLAGRCLRAHPPGRPDRGLLASDRRRGDRRRPEDRRFPPSAAGPRSTPAPLRRPCGRRSGGGACPSGCGSTTARPGDRGATCRPTWSAGWPGSTSR